MKIILFIMIIIVMLLPGCFLYHKPEFKGQILDVDTKQPIEKTVVVAVYNKRTMGLGAGTRSSIINVQEALTDKTGKFIIPSYSTLINPFSWESVAIFIIFKPGYASLEMDLEKELSGEKTPDREFVSRRVKLRSPGIIELPKLRTNEERRNSKPVPAGKKNDWIKQKELIKSIRDEWRYLYGENPDKLYRWEDN